MTTNKNHNSPNVPNSTDKGNKIRNVPALRFPEFTEEWENHVLQDTVTFSNGKAHENCVNEDGDYILVNSKFVSTNGQIQKRVTSQLSPLCKSQFVMVMSDLPNGKALAKCYYIEEDNKFTLNQRICSFSAKNGNISKFLMYQINRNKYYMRFDDGINQTNLKKNEVLSCPVFIPSIKEQEKIATLLHLIDERIATQNKIIEDLKKLKSAISKKLLCNDKWTTYKIQDIAEIGRGRVISSVEIDRQKHPLYPVYSSQTSNDGIMGYLDSYMFDGEYITWTTDGANAGTVFYRKGKFNCTNVCGTLKIQPKFDCYFVSLVLQQATQKYVSSNLANPKLMNNTMASIKIRMPNIETQKQLSKVFQTLDSCLLVHQRTCKMYLSEKQYLLCQMFI